MPKRSAETQADRPLRSARTQANLRPTREGERAGGTGHLPGEARGRPRQARGMGSILPPDPSGRSLPAQRGRRHRHPSQTRCSSGDPVARSSPQCLVLSWLFKCGPWATYHLLTLPASRPVRRRRLSGHLSPQSWGLHRARTKDLASGSSEPVRARGWRPGARLQVSPDRSLKPPLCMVLGSVPSSGKQGRRPRRHLRPPPAQGLFLLRPRPPRRGPAACGLLPPGGTRRPCLDSWLHPSRVHRQQEDGPPPVASCPPTQGPALPAHSSINGTEQRGGPQARPGLLSDMTLHPLPPRTASRPSLCPESREWPHRPYPAGRPPPPSPTLPSAAGPDAGPRLRPRD